MTNQILLLLTSCLIVSAANAANKPEKSPWKSEMELGIIRVTGNTQTQTLDTKGDVIYEVGKWHHHGHIEGYGQQTTDNSTGQSNNTAERYELSGQSDYKFDQYNYTFGLVKLQKDRFSGFEYENTASLGYGRKVIKQPAMELDLEAGPGVQFFKPNNSAATNEALLRLAGKYWWAITEHSKFTQNLSVDIGGRFTTTKSVTGVRASISDKLALKFTYTLRNKSSVPVGTKKTDTELATTLVYLFQ